MYKLRFSDETEFMGGEPENSLWNEIPQGKSIASMQYSFLDKGFLLNGFEAYNHIVERAVVLLNFSGQTYPPAQRITRIIILAKWQNRVYEVIYDIKNQSVYQQAEVIGKENIDKEGAEIGSLLSVTKVTVGWVRGKFDPLISPKLKVL
jgi:hypothetical protein